VPAELVERGVQSAGFHVTPIFAIEGRADKRSLALLVNVRL
jgi:hypothetical protein